MIKKFLVRGIFGMKIRLKILTVQIKKNQKKITH